MLDHNTTIHAAEQATRHWFERVVLGLNLCPFAHRPARQQQIRFYTSTAITEQALLDEVIQAIEHLASTPASTCETTLVITPELLHDFYDYQFFLEEANYQLKQHQWEGTFQLASFHPNYCFAGCEPHDTTNLTNRSPYPIIHILREASLSQVLEQVESPELIPERNMETVSGLSDEEVKVLFPKF